MAEQPSRSAVIRTSVVALALLVAWWAGVGYLDGALAAALPYERYETATLLYPEIYYPLLPGWIVAGSQPFAIGLYAIVAGWMIALSVGIGTMAARIAAGRDLSATAASAGIVVGLFVFFTAVEAVVGLAI